MLNLHFHRKDAIVHRPAQVTADRDVQQQVLRAVKGPSASVAIFGIEVFKVNAVVHADADLVL